VNSTEEEQLKPAKLFVMLCGSHMHVQVILLGFNITTAISLL